MSNIIRLGEPITGYKWIQQSNSAYGQDGHFCCKIGTLNYTVAGWINGANSHQRMYSSLDLITWNRIDDVPFSARHTFGAFVKNDIIYVVGGDIYIPASDSWKYESGSWTQISSDCGISNRSLMGSVLHNGDFYLIGGQLTTHGLDNYFTTVMKSTDNCANFSVIQANTPFANGNCYGTCVSFNGYIWVITGGIYDDRGYNFEHQKKIYKSIDGIDWECVGILPFLPRQYVISIVYDSMIWVLQGYNYQRFGNLNSVYCSSDGKIWHELKNTPWPARHAAGGHISTGLVVNAGTYVGQYTDVWELIKI